MVFFRVSCRLLPILFFSIMAWATEPHFVTTDANAQEEIARYDGLIKQLKAQLRNPTVVLIDGEGDESPTLHISPKNNALHLQIKDLESKRDALALKMESERAIAEVCKIEERANADVAKVIGLTLSERMKEAGNEASREVTRLREYAGACPTRLHEKLEAHGDLYRAKDGFTAKVTAIAEDHLKKIRHNEVRLLEYLEKKTTREKEENKNGVFRSLAAPDEDIESFRRLALEQMDLIREYSFFKMLVNNREVTSISEVEGVGMACSLSLMMTLVALGYDDKNIVGAFIGLILGIPGARTLYDGLREGSSSIAARLRLRQLERNYLRGTSSGKGGKKRDHLVETTSVGTTSISLPLQAMAARGLIALTKEASCNASPGKKTDMVIGPSPTKMRAPPVREKKRVAQEAEPVSASSRVGGAESKEAAAHSAAEFDEVDEWLEIDSRKVQR